MESGNIWPCVVDFFDMRSAFMVGPCCSMCQKSIPLYNWIIFLCMDHTIFVYSFFKKNYFTVFSIHLLIDIWVVSNFWLLYVVLLWISFCVDMCFQFSWVHTKEWVRFLDHKVNTLFNILKNCQTIFQSGYTMVHFCQLYVGSPFPTFYCQFKLIKFVICYVSFRVHIYVVSLMEFKISLSFKMG
jgi:hypothetical protein